MPGENIQDWSTTAATNGTADTLINWAEGQPRASVNNSARSMMAAHAKDRNLRNGSIVTAGSANAQTFLSGLSYTAVPTGLRVLLKNGFSNTAAMTLDLDGIGPVAVNNKVGVALIGGEVVANGYSEYLYNGTNWILLQDRQGITLLASSTASASTSIDFATGIDATYDEYEVHFTNVVPATNSANLQMIIATGAAVWQGNPTDYSVTFNVLNSGVNTPVYAATNLWLTLTLVQSNNAAAPANGRLTLCTPASSSFKVMRWETAYFNNNSSALILVTGAGFYRTASNPITGVRFLMSSGNIASGTFVLYGLKK